MAHVTRDISDEVALGDLRFSITTAGRVAPEEPHDFAMRWLASLSRVDEDERTVELATVELWTIERSSEYSVHLVLDEISSDFGRYAVFFDDEEFDEGLDLGGFGDGLVIVDRVAVPEVLRGNGFGPLLLVEALGVVSKGFAAIAGEPAPFELRPDQPEWLLERDRLEKLCGSFGFSEWRDGLWFIDPARISLDQTRERLHARFG